MSGLDGRGVAAPGAGRAQLTHIWRRDPRSGLWRHTRDSMPENADAWLKILRETEPGIEFRVARRRPRT